MGLGKTSSVVAYCGGRAASAGSAFKLLSTTTLSQSRTGGRPGVPVLYIDRGVIVLNKPPGLVSQGTSSAAPVAAKSHRPEATPPRTPFDDVLDGTARLFYYVVY